MESAPLDDRRKALFRFVAKLNRASTTVGPEDIEALKVIGWAEEAIYDAITVCALFNFYNTWIDGTGVSDMPAMGYERTGVRLAQDGYVMSKGKDGNG